jgi:hypothetical protein
MAYESIAPLALWAIVDHLALKTCSNKESKHVEIAMKCLSLVLKIGPLTNRGLSIIDP